MSQREENRKHKLLVEQRVAARFSALNGDISLKQLAAEFGLAPGIVSIMLTHTLFKNYEQPKN